MKKRESRCTSGDVENLIDVIYRTVLEPNLWPEVLERTAREVDGQKGLLLISADPARAISTPITYEVDPALIQRWIDGYLECDLWSHGMHGYSEGFVLTGASIVDPSVKRKSPWYNELLIDGKIEDCLSTSLAKHNDVHTVMSIYSDRHFQKHEIGLMRLLSPHLRRALRMQTQLGVMKARSDCAEALLDALTVGVMTLDPSGRVQYLNRYAERIVGLNDGLTIREHRLCAKRFDENLQLYAAITRAGATASFHAQPPGATLSISRPSLLRPFGIEVAPSLRNIARETSILPTESQRSSAVLVTMSDPELVVEPMPDRLARIFRLTPAEARLASALASRQSLEDYSERAGISIGTARWTLKRVLEKTGCRRQSEFVHLVATSIASTVLLGTNPEGNPSH